MKSKTKNCQNCPDFLKFKKSRILDSDESESGQKIYGV